MATYNDFENPLRLVISENVSIRPLFKRIIVTLTPTLALQDINSVEVRTALSATTNLTIARNFSGPIQFSATTQQPDLKVYLAANPIFGEVSTNSISVVPGPNVPSGTYTVTVTATSIEKNLSATKTFTVVVVGNNAPVADFTFTTNNDTVVFTDASTDSDGSIASRLWRFGDGTISSAQNPTKIYNVTLPTTFNVELVVTDNFGKTGTKQQAVTVSPRRSSTPSILLRPNTNILSVSGLNAQLATTISIDRTDYANRRVDLRVTSSPSGLVTTLNESATTANAVTLTITPRAFGTFTITVVGTGEGVAESKANITLTVAANTYRTVMYANPAQGGSVTGTSDTTQAPRNLQNGRKELEATESTSTSLTATESTGYTFVGWYLNNTLFSTNKTINVTSAVNGEFEARFALIPSPTPSASRTVIPPSPTPSASRTVIPPSPTPSASRTVISPSPTPSASRVVIRELCKSPNLPAIQNISIPCSQIDIKYNGGQAFQRQTLRVDTTQLGPGDCPYVWENSGLPDVSQCTIPVFWRSCVTGQLIEGTPPADFQETEFLGAGGGACWEPLTEIAFEPNLNEALRYSYQRGSSKYPTGKNIKVTNPSYGTAYRITVTTNPDITLSTRSQSGNKGALSFTIGPRSSETLIVNVTPKLLQTLQDGVANLLMIVEYQRVVA
jgi:uncharacterized repeat protein (TIGR02543 family)